MSILTATVYQRFRKESTDPVEVVHKIYNHTCPEHLKIESINEFQMALEAWVAKRKIKIMAGSLMILKFYDSKFAQ